MKFFKEIEPDFVRIKEDQFWVNKQSHIFLRVLIQKIQPIRKYFQNRKLICYSMNTIRSKNRDQYCAFCSTRYKCSQKLRLSMIGLEDQSPLILDINRSSFNNLTDFLSLCPDDFDHTPVALKVILDEHDFSQIDFSEI